MAPGSVSEPRPAARLFCHAHFAAATSGVVERILGRVAGLDGDGAVFRQQQHHAHLQHQCRLICRRPQHVIQRADPCQLAAEGIEQLDRAHALMRGHRSGAPAGGEMRHDDSDHGEQHECRDVGRVGDREGVDRRQEEEIVAERSRDGGEQRRPKPVANGDADDCRQKHEIDVLDAEQWLDQPGRHRAPRQPPTARRRRDADRTARLAPPRAPSSSGSVRRPARRRRSRGR